MSTQAEQIEIRFTGLISQNIYLRAQKLHQGSRRLVLFIYPIALAVFLPLINFRGGKFPAAARILIIVAGCLFVLLMLLWQRYMFIRRFKKSPYLNEPITGSVTGDRLYIESKLGHNDTPWSTFIKYKQNDDLVLLYQGPGIFQVLAKEFFSGPEEWERAKVLLTTKFRSNRV